MKTKNNIQKTALKAVAAATGLAILSFTVNAQGVLKSLFENEEINHIAMIMENANHNSFASNTHNRSFTSAETFAAYLVNETEEPLNIEDWMSNENTFDVFSTALETETETEMVIENWMMNENSFTATLKIETESELVLEDWMMNEKILNNNQIETKVTKNESKPISTATFFYREVNTEEKLEVESWMTNQSFLGK